MERRFGEVAIHEIGRPQPELAQDAAAVAAFEDAMMATVGDVQAFVADRQAQRKTQGLPRLRMQLGTAARRCRRRTVAQRIQRTLKLSRSPQPDQPLLLATLRVQQHHGRPRCDAEATPAIPVGIEQDRH